MTSFSFHDDVPQATVVVLGAPSHGKTFLSAALTQVAAKNFGGEGTGPSELASTFTFRSMHRLYTVIDARGAGDALRAQLAAAGPVQGLIVVVDAAQGGSPALEEQLLLARELGCAGAGSDGGTVVLVYLNRCDVVTDEEQRAIASMEAEELLYSCDFSGAQLTVNGSALQALEGAEEWQATVMDVVAWLDGRVPTAS